MIILYSTHYIHLSHVGKKNNKTKTIHFPYYHRRNETAPARRGRPGLRAYNNIRNISTGGWENIIIVNKNHLASVYAMPPPMHNIKILDDAERGSWQSSRTDYNIII